MWAVGPRTRVADLGKVVVETVKQAQYQAWKGDPGRVVRQRGHHEMDETSHKFQLTDAPPWHEIWRPGSYNEQPV